MLKVDKTSKTMIYKLPAARLIQFKFSNFILILLYWLYWKLIKLMKIDLKPPSVTVMCNIQKAK